MNMLGYNFTFMCKLEPILDEDMEKLHNIIPKTYIKMIKIFQDDCIIKLNNKIKNP